LSLPYVKKSGKMFLGIFVGVHFSMLENI